MELSDDRSKYIQNFKKLIQNINANDCRALTNTQECTDILKKLNCSFVFITKKHDEKSDNNNLLTQATANWYSPERSGGESLNNYIYEYYQTREYADDILILFKNVYDIYIQNISLIYPTNQNTNLSCLELRKSIFHKINSLHYDEDDIEDIDSFITFFSKIQINSSVANTDQKRNEYKNIK